jgi:UPF0716 protein FxsA
MRLIMFLIWIGLEVFGFIWVAEHVGTLITVLLVVLSSLIGFMMLRMEGLRLLRFFTDRLFFRKDAITLEEMKTMPYVLFSAGLFIIPGFFSDIFALFCFLPFIRHWLARRLMGKKKEPSHSDGSQKIEKGRTFDQ